MKSEDGRRRLSPAAERLAGAVLVTMSVLLTLFALELVARFHNGSDWLVRWPNFILHQQAVRQSEISHEFEFDPLIGYRLRPNYRDAAKGISMDAEGFRNTPAPAVGLGVETLTRPPILVMGDSFAFGDEVRDEDTWAALLQPLTHRKVLNGGVVGYGLDQIVLRSEQLVAETKPQLLVVAVIADDLRRSEFRHQWGREKPYFTLTQEGQLALQNVPVDPNAPLPLWLSTLQHTLGWSALAEQVMRRLGLSYEWQGASVRATPAGTGQKLACPLMDRLAKLKVPTLVVGIYAPHVWRLKDKPPLVVDDLANTRLMLDCAARAGLTPFDSYAAIDKVAKADPSAFNNFHYALPATKALAEAVADVIAKMQAR
ncbi:MAG: hypothetical protein JOY81_00565 [Alphaproteobacteria bacterium]|nr:hypothetical protein [Alphaproteobacteria bacterium]